MNLAIDIGNTCAKLAVIENGQVVDFFKTDTLSEVYLEQLLENFPDITGAILISGWQYLARGGNAFQSAAPLHTQTAAVRTD